MNELVNSNSNRKPANDNRPRRMILGVQVDDQTLSDAIRTCDHWLSDGQQHFIITPNPEMLVAAAKNSDLRRTLNYASLSAADGFGIILASQLLGQPIRNRIAGVDLAEAILTLATRKKSRVFFLGATPGTAAKAADRMRIRHPGVNIVGASDGGVVGDPMAKNTEITNAIALTRPDILIVAFGHGKQEQFIHTHLPALPTVRIAIGVGGAFDYWSGRTSRAPIVFRRLGLEWLYRLMIEPRRFARIIRATIIFPYLVLTTHAQNHVRN